MKKSRILILTVAIMMLFTLSACSGGATPASDAAPAPASDAAQAPASDAAQAPASDAAQAPASDAAQAPAPDVAAGSSGEAVAGANIAFIVPADDALGINDKGWIQKTWEGVKNYGDANGKTYTWYRPNDNSTQGYSNAIATAVNSGTEVVVCLGFQPVEALAVAQNDYPDTHFISVEANGVETDLAKNHYAIFHQADQAGFLAGVAAVKGGFKNIGIITGLDIPPMNIWTWGYLQGINYAAGKENIQGIKVRHTYANTSAASPEVQTLAASWYADGLDLIMPMIAGGNNSLFAAAETAKKPCFGADVDQGVESENVLTSPVKRLELTVSNAVATVYDGSFPGGTFKWFNVDDNAVGLATEHWRVPNYTVEQYQADFDAFKSDVDSVRTGLLAQDKYPSIDELWTGIATKNIEFTNIK